jgi:dsRNA-specific ribonuclease
MTLPTVLPALPGILSEDIQRQVFAHSSSLIFTANAVNPPQSNERLEFLGDSYLNFCISNVLYREFPTMTPGDLTALRAGIVSNSNLNTWARAYGLQNHLVMGYSMAHLQIPEKAEKPIADVFEAYIGGVIVSNPQSGRGLVEEFLEALVQPTLEEQKMILDGTVKVDKMAVGKLYEASTIQKKKLEFRFVDSQVSGAEDRWEAICSWGGKEAGRAKARNQQEAKHRVAAMVLQELQQTS